MTREAKFLVLMSCLVVDQTAYDELMFRLQLRALLLKFRGEVFRRTLTLVHEYVYYDLRPRLRLEYL